MKANDLHIDYETFSRAPIKAVGHIRYSEDPSTEVLMCSYAMNHDPVKVWVPEELGYYANADGDLDELYYAMKHADRIWAHNANFERAITENVCVELPNPPLTKYRDTAAMAAMLSLPRPLGDLPSFLKLDVRKDPKGVSLMKKFSIPRKPTAKNLSVRIRPKDDPDAFEQYIEYGRQDVITERALHDRLREFELPPGEQSIWIFDSVMNFRGLPIDRKAVHDLSIILAEHSKKLVKLFRSITGVNPTQVEKVLGWLNSKGMKLFDLQAETLEELINSGVDFGEQINAVLRIRQSLSMSSTKKLAVMLLTKSLYDDRIRGTLLYHGASTGRWSGRLIQPQNFPRGGLSPREVDQALELASLHNLEAFSVIFGDPMNAAKNCLRGMIKAAPGKDLIVADYSAIEARVVCWLAGQEDVLQLYRENKDAYKDMASFLYGVDYDRVNGDQRFMGKSIVLGCGFGMGWQTFLATSQKDGNVISEAMAQNAVVSFRERYYLVEKLWGDIDRAAKRVIRTGKPERVGKVFMFIKDIFFCVRLPSGRCLYYPYPRIEDRKTKFGNSKSITFQSTKKKGEVWLREGTYGGKMVENITQAVARDVMSSGMMNAENNGYPMITTVHDEPVSEVEEGTGSVEEFIKLICTLPAWAKGLPIKAEGYRAKRYKK